MSEEIKSFASQISELMFENTDKIPEGVYLEVMNKLKNVVDVASNNTTRIKYQNIDYKDKYLTENHNNIMLTAGLLHTMFKPIESNPNLTKYDFIDLNHCLNIKAHSGTYETHQLTEVLSVEYEGYVELDDITLKSFMTTTCLRGNMLCLYTSSYITTGNGNTLARDYIGNYYVNDLLHYEYAFTRNDINTDVDVFIKILKLNKKNMLVNIYICVKDTDVNKNNIEVFRRIKQEKVHIDYSHLGNINKLVPIQMTLGIITSDKIFHKYLQTDPQYTIELDFEKTFYETDIHL